MRTNIVTYLIILILGISCKQTDKKIAEKRTDRNEVILDSIHRIEKLDTIANYKPLSLNFKGKPIFAIGQKLTEIDSTLNYRIDPNLDYQDYFPTVKDYITTEDNLSVHKIGKHSYVNGILYFSADQKSQRIFNVSGTWGFQVYESGIIEKMEIWLTENLFPALKNKFEFKDNWSYKIETENQIEHFELNKKNENWILNYEVELK
ncbi:hypothetical protein [Tenacibaculum mesophilum]|uniref:hypothetical protein n=1 Tax=Tenacibaculum mesophilum TaxID=104268 RepID=UPI00248FCCA3|nr:hypothetical protein [Tenacibaculum mesophilum]